MTIDKTAIRNAATVVVLRDRDSDPHVLMGQRGAKAAFMPNKFVFPGGAVDAGDADVPLAAPVPSPCRDRLRENCAQDLSHALAVAAIRELWEESGLLIGTPGDWPGADIPPDWTGFARQLFSLSGTPQVLTDRAAGTSRLAFADDSGALLAAVFIAPTPVTVARDHIASLIGTPIDGVLAARQKSDVPDPGPTVCSCMGVGANAILRPIRFRELLATQRQHVEREQVDLLIGKPRVRHFRTRHNSCRVAEVFCQPVF